MNDTRTYVDLYDIVPDADIDYSRYWEAEKTLGPLLEGAGYTLSGPWWTGDGDSFGPLTRCIGALDPQGSPVVVVYG